MFIVDVGTPLVHHLLDDHLYHHVLGNDRHDLLLQLIKTIKC
jgi:hypothetical protein